MTGRYHSPRREDAAAATRAAILRHAQELFLERGYAGATVPEIARAAQAMAAAGQSDDPHRVLALCARGARSGQERYWDLACRLMRQPPDDALARQAVANIADKCLAALAGIAGRLRDLEALKPGTGLAQATDTLWFYFGQNAWVSLVGERGWTFDQAEIWLREAASRDLLDPAAPVLCHRACSGSA